MPKNEFYFIWDYDLSTNQFEEILKNKEHPQHGWLVARILQYAKWEDIWRYLDIKQIREGLPKIHLRNPLKRCWEIAIERWTHA